MASFETVASRYNFDMYNRIGQGREGTVYPGICSADNTPVAMKIVRKYTMCDCDTCGGKLPRELCLLMKCQGIQGVIKVYDIFVSNYMTLVVMERPKNYADLWNLIDAQVGLPVDTAKHYFRQIVKTLNGMKERGVVHGDVKNENIVIDIDTQQTKVIDFGYAHPTNCNVIGCMVGTPVFQPPESYTGGAYMWEPVTVWTLGTMLYTMVIGFEPFQDEKDAINDESQFEILTNFPSSMEDLIRRMLAKKPNERPSLDDILKHEWLVETPV